MRLLAITTLGAVLIGLVTGAVLVLIVISSIAARRRGRRGPELDIPPSMRPAPSDADLERPVLEKFYIWGGVLFLFLGIWVPVVWLREPSNNFADQRHLKELSVVRGERTVDVNSEENPTGLGCVRCHGGDLAGGQNVFNGQVVTVPPLTDVCGGESTGHPAIRSLQDVVDVIAQGRPNTDMPSWSVKFAGSADDETINDIVNYILSIQTVPDDKNVCLNPPETETG